jgi:acetoin utilization deacetylase AcuC-like enzyme
MDSLRADESLWNSLHEMTPDEAKKGLIQAVHTEEHFKRVAGAFENGLSRLDVDTVISMHSFDAAMLGAGGACRAVDAVMGGEVDNAFVAVRPPGHHATSESAMGFCLFNNIAVGARYAQNKYKEISKVAILDWDVHHGNGTQGIFYDDPSVFFFSMHQYPWFPGTGSRGETGIGRGKDYTLNVPVKAKTSAVQQVRDFENAISEIASRFRPDMIFISAGFDGHVSDPLGQLMLEDRDFRKMTDVVKQWADEVCDGRIVSCLEGGYNLSTLGTTVAAHVSELTI